MFLLLNIYDIISCLPDYDDCDGDLSFSRTLQYLYFNGFNTYHISCLP